MPCVVLLERVDEFNDGGDFNHLLAETLQEAGFNLPNLLLLRIPLSAIRLALERGDVASIVFTRGAIKLC